MNEVLISKVTSKVQILTVAFLFNSLLPAEMVCLVVGSEVGHQIKFITDSLLIWKRPNLQDTSELSTLETALSSTPRLSHPPHRALASISPMSRLLT